MYNKSVYPWSREDAIANNELELWRESYRDNCTCARAIEKAIKDGYKDNSLNTDAAKDIIAEYGYNRVNWVLANTIQQHDIDGRYSLGNKEWANTIYIPNDENRWHFCVGSHPGLTNMFVDQVRKEWQALGLYDHSHCSDETNYTDHLLVIKPSTLKDEYKHPDYQLFFAKGGFGCDPKASGTVVYGHFLKDDEYAQFRRSDFIGVIKDEYIPEWAEEKLQQYTNPEETTEMKMEEM